MAGRALTRGSPHAPAALVGYSDGNAPRPLAVAIRAATATAFEAIKAILPPRSPAYDAERNIWLEHAVVDKLAALRGSGKTFSHVILRLAAEGPRQGSSISGSFLCHLGRRHESAQSRLEGQPKQSVPCLRAGNRMILSEVRGPWLGQRSRPLRYRMSLKSP